MSDLTVKSGGRYWFDYCAARGLKQEEIQKVIEQCDRRLSYLLVDYFIREQKANRGKPEWS
jgi:hypothetical protein